MPGCDDNTDTARSHLRNSRFTPYLGGGPVVWLRPLFRRIISLGCRLCLFCDGATLSSYVAQITTCMNDNLWLRQYSCIAPDSLIRRGAPPDPPEATQSLNTKA